MEPKRKLMAGASCIESESMKDRLSSLPDEVVHYILSLTSPTDCPNLDIKDLTRFSCVSKRCRQLMLSNPRLRLDVYPSHEFSCKNRVKFMNSLDRLLAHRGDNKLLVFDILWYEHCSEEGKCFQDEEIFRVLTWVHNVIAKCKVETLDLFFEECISAYDTKLLALPMCIFHAESLRSLTVEFHCCKIQVPSFTFFSNLKSLKLSFVTIVDEAFFKWISRCCNCIEDLYLDCISGPKNVTIESSSLKSFHFVSYYSREMSHLHISGVKLQKLTIEWRFDEFYSRDVSLSMFTPNLKRISWVGHLMTHLNMGKFVCLEEAELRLLPGVNDWNNVFKVLCSLHGVKAVILTEQLIKTSGFNIEFWKLQDPAFFSQLKDLTIELWEASNGIELARYVLEHAHNLEKMVVVYLQEHSGVERLLTESKMISNATLVFKSVPYCTDPYV